MKLPAPAILVITDRSQCREPLEARALALFRGGCRWLSLREKDLAAEARQALLARLIEIARPFGATVGVHGDLVAAHATGAALHLPDGADVAAARSALGMERLIGRSCHDADGLAAARAGGADYATLGPIAPTASKPGYVPARATGELARMAKDTPLAVLALGGVTADTARAPIAAGFAGIALMGEAMRTPEPEAWFARLAAAAPGEN